MVIFHNFSFNKGGSIKKKGKYRNILRFFPFFQNSYVTVVKHLTKKKKKNLEQNVN